MAHREHIAHEDLAACFAADGPVARHIDAFTVRHGQQDMASIIAESLEEGEVLFCEAGTGIGKTLAYLIPVLLSGCRTIISTGTRHLQEQIRDKDLPSLCQALSMHPEIAVLKGRGNYLCLQRMQLALAAVSKMRGTDVSAALHQWQHSTESGDFSEFPRLPENSPLLPLMSSTTDNCLGGDCKYFDDCFVYKARRHADEADLIIINHQVMLADMVLRASGGNSILPEPELIIFDEAHLLPDLATLAFGRTLTSYEFLDLNQDISQAQKEETGDSMELADLLFCMQGTLKQVGQALPERTTRSSWSALQTSGELRESLHNLLAQQTKLQQYLDSQKTRGERLAQCHRRCAEQGERLFEFLDTDSDEQVQWVEARDKGFALNITPLNVARAFQERLAYYGAPSIYTSATLAAGEDFQHFAGQLGFVGARSCQIASPFRLQEQALLYLPRDLPDPNQEDFPAAFLERVRVLLGYSRGRAFVLFTSYKALRHAAQYLEAVIPWPLLVQGQDSRSSLLQRFREQVETVLLGTRSFWEGVDVRGDALSHVIIEKLPFASPGDPVTQARIDAMKKAGRNPFMEYQLPQAMLGLKQGVGRLIRDMQDRGVCTICDRRIYTRHYGKRIRDMLAAWRHTDSIEDVRCFYSSAAHISKNE